MTELIYKTCKNCGYVHFGVTLEKAEADVKKFNEYYNTLSKKERDLYYGSKGASLDTYKSCMRCGGSHRDFKDSAYGDCPIGCTINPILLEENT